MRTTIMAGVVSIGCLSAQWAVAQAPLWFAPETAKQAAVTDAALTESLGSGEMSSPASSSSATSPSLRARFNNLLGSSSTRWAAATQTDSNSVITAVSTSSVDASGHTPESTSTLIPWSNTRSKQRFSFAELDAAAGQQQHADAEAKKTQRRSLGGTPNVQRGALVAPLVPQTAPSLLSNPDTSHSPPQPAMPWENTLVEAPQPPTPARSTPAHLTSASRPAPQLLDELSLDIPIPLSKILANQSAHSPSDRATPLPLAQPRPPAYATSVSESTSEPDVERTADQQPTPAQGPNSASKRRVIKDNIYNENVKPQPVRVPQPARLTAQRFTDTHAVDRLAQTTQSQATQSPATQSPATQSPATQSQGTPSKPSQPQDSPSTATQAKTASQKELLQTESMIGPMKGADQLFGRLELQDDVRGYAQPATSGPRVDAINYAWMPTPYTWISPAFYHHPLYFEQPNLERYGVGRARVVQPLLSSMHFFGSIPLVPYKTLTHHPRERVYTLGQGRPGNCVPVQRGVILGQSTVGEVSMFWEECSGY